MTEELDSVDFALAAYREDGLWQVQAMAATAYESVATLTEALRRLPHDDGALGMIAVDEDFFILARVDDASTRVLLSDMSAADEWELAQSALDFLALPEPEDDDDEVPAGDLDLLHDLGFHTMDMAELLEDGELFPDEALLDIAQRLGFGDEFAELVGITSS